MRCLDGRDESRVLIWPFGEMERLRISRMSLSRKKVEKLFTTLVLAPPHLHRFDSFAVFYADHLHGVGVCRIWRATL